MRNIVLVRHCTLHLAPDRVATCMRKRSAWATSRYVDDDANADIHAATAHVI